MKILTALILAASTSFAAVVGRGTASTVETVKAGETDSYQEWFVSGEQAGAIVSGDGDTDLDLYVYDEYGNLICKSETYGDDEVCTWTPTFNSIGARQFKVKIMNRGSVYNNYTILLY
jgi:hypothetical protein